MPARWLYRGAQAVTRNRAESTISNVAETVQGIIANVRQNGNRALDEYCETFDRVPHKQLGETDVESCLQSCTKQELDDIAYAQANIRRFAQHQRDSMVRAPLLPPRELRQRLCASG